MEGNSFNKNRQKVQKAIRSQKYIEPLLSDTLVIEETKKNAKLRKVILKNIPHTEDDIQLKSWILNLEDAQTVFANSPKVKTVEKALMFFTCGELWIILIELKSSLQDETLEQIEQKINDSIARTALLLSSYIFKNDLFDKVNINYKSFIFYNQNHIRQDSRGRFHDFYTIINEKEKRKHLENIITEKETVLISFIKNDSGNEAEYTLDFAEFFQDNYEFTNWEYSGLSLPEEKQK